jgi:beta-glucosidase
MEAAPATTRQDAVVDFDWSKTQPPGLPNEGYSVRWTGTITAPKDGDYLIGVHSDGEYRLFIGGGKLVIDAWSPYPAETRYALVTLKGGQPLAVRLDYFQVRQKATVALLWKPVGLDDFSDSVAAAQRADVVVFAGGISSQIEGEEGTPFGGDRQTLDLPIEQQQLLKALVSTGKPVVFVLMSGSAIAINWAQGHVPAILEAWYSGEEGGDAIADVLFGDYDPAGRLPITFYKGVDQLPDFSDYSMAKRTYRYFKGEPLYPFGYGLSYTRFAYDEMDVPRHIAPGSSATVSARVRNVGDRAGDEVVEVYLRPLPEATKREIAPGQEMPRLLLAGFQRISLAPGESRTVSFTLSPNNCCW